MTTPYFSFCSAHCTDRIWPLMSHTCGAHRCVPHTWKQTNCRCSSESAAVEVITNEACILLAEETTCGCREWRRRWGDAGPLKGGSRKCSSTTRSHRHISVICLIFPTSRIKRLKVCLKSYVPFSGIIICTSQGHRGSKAACRSSQSEIYYTQSHPCSFKVCPPPKSITLS